MELKVIAYARNGHTDKFGIPRQSREESPILTRIVFEPEYNVAEALRGIEGYSHLWLIWGFSEVDTWSPTVRPPRLGGNKRIGVFATRSPFRPNPIGLSSVRLIAVRLNSQCTIHNSQLGDKSTDRDFDISNSGIPECPKSGRMELIVSGADVLDGTPIYDIKPYLSFSDSHPEAKNGFAEETKDYQLEVDWRLAEGVECVCDGLVNAECPPNHPVITPLSPPYHPLPSDKKKEIEYILSQDPRPAYQADPKREYKMDYSGYTVTFAVENRRVVVKKVEWGKKINKDKGCEKSGVGKENKQR